MANSRPALTFPNYLDIQLKNGIDAIGGLLSSDHQFPPRIGKDFLSKDLHIDKSATPSEKVLTNGLMLLQCVAHFDEFFDNNLQTNIPLQDVEYENALWAVIIDELKYPIPGLTPKYIKAVYNMFTDARLRWKCQHGSQTSRITKARGKRLLELLDAQMDRSGRVSKSRKRNEQDFTLRLTTRVIQWRKMYKTPQKLLSLQNRFDSPKIQPAGEWNDESKQLARYYATQFEMDAPVFPVTQSRKKRSLPATSSDSSIVSSSSTVSRRDNTTASNTRRIENLETAVVNIHHTLGNMMTEMISSNHRIYEGIKDLGNKIDNMGDKLSSKMDNLGEKIDKMDSKLDSILDKR